MQIDYTPHPAQLAIHKARDARFRTVCTGRRFGKTLCMAAELLDRGGGEIGGDYGWVAPTYGVAERGVEAFRTIAPEFVRVVGRMPTRVEFEGAAGPCRVFMLSADNPDSIRGFGFRGIVVDEAAAVPVDVWNYVLRPTLAQTLGWGVFISTPAGRNWFYDMFTRGVERQEGFRSFTFPSNVSPYFPAKEWEEARRTLPEDVFRQEYMAEFLEDSAGVFRGIDACLMTEEEDRIQNSESRRRSVVVGCDIAKHTDWTVCIAMDAKTGLCLEIERFNQLDWPVQRERIAAFVKRWQARLVMDAMIYQISKEIGAMSTVLEGDVDAIILTGGMAHSARITEAIGRRVGKIAPLSVYPGEDEMEALALNGLYVLRGEIRAKEYL